MSKKSFVFGRIMVLVCHYEQASDGACKREPTFWICMGDLLQIPREKNISHSERQQWKEEIMEMGHALQQTAMPEGVSKKRLRAGNVMTRLWMKQLCSSIGAESKYITFPEQVKTGATSTEGNYKLHTV